MKTERRKMYSFRLDTKTRDALKRKAAEFRTSQSNAVAIMLGTSPESAYSAEDKRGKLIVR